MLEWPTLLENNTGLALMLLLRSPIRVVITSFLVSRTFNSFSVFRNRFVFRTAVFLRLLATHCSHLPHMSGHGLRFRIHPRVQHKCRDHRTRSDRSHRSFLQVLGSDCFFSGSVPYRCLYEARNRRRVENGVSGDIADLFGDRNILPVLWYR